MGGGHGILVVDLAIGFAGVVVGRAVPTGDADFTFEDSTVRRRSSLGGGRRGGLGLLLGRRRWSGGLDGAMTAAGDQQAEKENSREEGGGAHPLRLAGVRGLMREIHDAHFSALPGNPFFQFYLKLAAIRVHPYLI